jgi:asparagine synthetase B (glutamine-hydrolysing)
MRTDVLHRRGELLRSPGDLADVVLRDGHLVARGDDTGVRRTLVYLDAERLGIFRDWAPLVRELGGLGLLEVDPAGCQFLLAYGLVPAPYTLYSGVYALGVGDRLEVDLVRDRATFTVEFPYFEDRSRQSGSLDPDELEALLGAAVERAVPAAGPALFMQSAGKDSTGLLLGLAAAGRTRVVRAATYDPGWREREGPEAAALARRFGLAHTTVGPDPAAELAALLRFLEHAPSICADVALVGYLHTLERSEVGGGVVIDGLGNDAYMGYVQPRAERWLSRLSLPRLAPATWGRMEPPDLGSRGSYLLKSMLMYPAERSLAGSRLSPSAVRALLPQPGPFDRFFPEVDRSCRGLSPVDFRAFVRGRHFDGCGTMVKGRRAAAHHGARAVFPYADPRLIERCFHLPRAERYDEERGTNKLVLRRLLERRIGDAPYLRAKGSFRFDVLRFAEANAARIHAEIGAAAHLLRDLDRRVAWLLARRSNYVHAYALVTLLILSAWLARRPRAVLGRLAGDGARVPQASVRVDPGPGR